VLRCFFHLVNHDEVFPDLEGVEVISLERAREQAIQAAAELRSELGIEVGDWDGWHLRVEDADGDVLFAICVATGETLPTDPGRTLS